MSDGIPDGGPAFPETPLSGGHPGMSLRDYFAAHALAGMCSGGKWPAPMDGPEIARRAYIFADAMLQERLA